ncbi:MAG TPA: gamma-glutamylcyclotransferase [Cyclobacteriaceae bacterium]|nr:gamma-glutamylcyclotransferase [Cyclobacteriaceae bacterium]
MNANSTYAFYGSLRMGMSNYDEFKEGLEFQFLTVIYGFQLYRMENYPYAVKTGNHADGITVEVFKVTNPEIEKSIHALELEVGYHYEEVEIRGNQVGIYLYKSAGPEPLVRHGDWAKFFGS